MKNKWFICYFFIVFLVGWLSHGIYANNFLDLGNAFPTAYKTLEPKDNSLQHYQSALYPSQTESESFLVRFFLGDNERNSPKDRIKEDQIHVYNNRVIIEIDNPTWSKFVDTNSMDPMFDYGANGIEVTPQTPNDIKIGDVISYEYKESIIAHRVVDIKEDDIGIYFITKGDNNVIKDPFKVRFEQVRGVLVGLIY